LGYTVVIDFDWHYGLHPGAQSSSRYLDNTRHMSGYGLSSIEETMMVAQPKLQYIVDEQGDAVSVIVPIEVWRDLMSERETAYLLQSETMRQRLLEAKERRGGISLLMMRCMGECPPSIRSELFSLSN
jgi:PHD/YefM family antitoxin component YafN of YafNO toxin-antitoxin module